MAKESLSHAEGAEKALLFFETFFKGLFFFVATRYKVRKEESPQSYYALRA